MSKVKQQTIEEPVTIAEGMALSTQRMEWPVIIGNDLIQQARYKSGSGSGKSMSVTEQKILYTLISRIQKDDQDLVPQEFRIKDFCKLCGIPLSGGKTISDLMKVVKRLVERTMWLYNSKDDTITTVRWIDKAQIRPNGIIIFTLDNDMKPYLLGLKQYTKLYLHDIVRMRSKYSVILYQILMSYKNLERPIVFPLQDFRELLDADKVSYRNLGKLKSRVIEPAVKDINDYSSIAVTYELITEHGVATKIRFRIRNLRDSNLLEDQSEYVRRVNLVEYEIAESGSPSLALTDTIHYDSMRDVLVTNGNIVNATYDKDNNEYIITPSSITEEVRTSIPRSLRGK